MMQTGLVLGAGGVLGAAWSIGALAALQDLACIGANLMDPSRRAQVLETSLRTTTATLRAGRAAA